MLGPGDLVNITAKRKVVVYKSSVLKSRSVGMSMNALTDDNVHCQEYDETSEYKFCCVLSHDTVYYDGRIVKIPKHDGNSMIIVEKVNV
jgi:hypothetical protein